MTQPLLPSFNELVQLAQQDPQALESLRLHACEQLIQAATPEEQRKLRGLQFKIDMERQRSKSTTSICIRLSEKMHTAFTQLKSVLSQAQTMRPVDPLVEKNISANILPFSTHQQS